jgi:CRP-like cAMP-binding protein
VAEVLLKLAMIEGTSTVEGLCVRQVLSQQELASMVGTAREVVNRTLKKLEQDNLLRVRPAEIIILDIEGLERIAAEETR